jgi:hypothetical protein
MSKRPGKRAQGKTREVDLGKDPGQTYNILGAGQTARHVRVLSVLAGMRGYNVQCCKQPDRKRRPPSPYQTRMSDV